MKYAQTTVFSWRRVATILGVSLLLTTPGYATANDIQRSIYWSLNTAPPFHITNEPYRNQGICDSLMQAVENALPDYTTERQLMPQTRIGVRFRRNENQCFPCMIHQPNNDNAAAWFSNPTHTYTPHGIITRPETAARLREEFGNPVSLSKLLQSNEFRFGQPASRRYGELQTVLDSYENDDSYRVIRTGEHATTAILEMILADRIQYTIDYEALLNYHQRTASGQLEFVNIKENMGQQVVGAIGCTNNPWGRHLIEQINQNMSIIQQDANFQQSLNLWLNDLASLPDQTP